VDTGIKDDNGTPVKKLLKSTFMNKHFGNSSSFSEAWAVDIVDGKAVISVNNGMDTFANKDIGAFFGPTIETEKKEIPRDELNQALQKVVNDVRVISKKQFKTYDGKDKFQIDLELLHLMSTKSWSNRSPWNQPHGGFVDISTSAMFYGMRHQDFVGKNDFFKFNGPDGYDKHNYLAGRDLYSRHGLVSFANLLKNIDIVHSNLVERRFNWSWIPDDRAFAPPKPNPLWTAKTGWPVWIGTNTLIQNLK
jgi:hypothetical protein